MISRESGDVSVFQDDEAVVDCIVLRRPVNKAGVQFAGGYEAMLFRPRKLPP
jgi:hypothetical protein